MNNNKFKDHFKRRLLIAASAGLFFSSLCVAAISIWPLYNHLKAQQANELIFAVKTRSMVVEEFLAKAQETARQITSRSKIRESLEQYNNGEIDITALKDFTVPKLQDAINLSEFAVGINRLDVQGKSVVQVGLPVPEQLVHTFDVTENDLMLSGPVTIDNDLFIAVSAPIIDRQGNLVGTDIVIFSISKLRELVQDYTGLGKTGETMLGRLNANGQPDLFFPMRPTKETEDKALDSLQLTFSAPAQEGTVHLSESPNDLVAYKSIENIDWIIIVRMDKSELFEAVTREVLIILMIVGLIIPLGIMGLILLLRRILSHVGTLEQEITAKENAIRERDLTEARLRDEKELLNVTLRSICNGVIATDLDGKIILFNKISENLTGWSQQEAIGRSIQEVFSVIDEQTGEPCESPVIKVLSSGQIVGFADHTVLIAKDGTQYVIEESGAPILDQESNIIGTVLVFRDVTEEKRTAEELAKIEKLKSVGVLAGGIAHDFNNILAAILGNIELAKIYTDSSNKAYPLLEEAKKASIRAKSLTQQLLTFAKGGDPIKQTASIGKVITDSANFVLHGSSIVCDYDIPEDLWQVSIDTGQISQVIQNIIINARQAMPNGGTLRVCCENITDIRREEALLLPAQKYIKITIADSGFGIPAEHLDKIFDPYFSTKQEGSGLGLAICHSIISKHDGNISVQSEPEKGTTFIIYLPASIENARDIDTTQQCVVGSEHKATIMIMDDDSMMRELAKKMLEHFGHEVVLPEPGMKQLNYIINILIAITLLILLLWI